MRDNMKDKTYIHIGQKYTSRIEIFIGLAR